MKFQPDPLDLGASREDQVRQVLRLLKPYGVEGYSKVRIGRDYDGGYILIDDFSDIAISLGVGLDSSWDVAMAARGVHVYQYDRRDPLGEAGRTDSPLITFTKEKVTNLNHILEPHKDVILKMDIEGDEWVVFRDTDFELLKRCRQMVCELHNFEQLPSVDFNKLAHACLAKVSEAFFVCHVHANNHVDTFKTGSITFPGILEVTFANRARYRSIDVEQTFPTDLDRPNKQGYPDINLGTFTF